MPAGDYIEGLAFFGAMLGGTLGGAWLILDRRLPALDGVVGAVAFFLLATLGVIAVHLAPLTVGELSRGSVLVTTAVWVGAAALVPAARSAAGDAKPASQPTGSEGPPRSAGGERAAWGLAMLGVGLITALMLALGGNGLLNPSGAIDILNFHLPGVARWIETGSLWQIDVFLPGVSPGHYPNNGDVILLASVLPWHNDFLAHLAMWPFFALTGVSTYALARELTAPRQAAVLAGCLVLAIPAVSIPADDGLVDAVMLFGFSTGLVFLIRHHRTAATSDLVLAGLALGLALGTKWYGVSAVAIVFAVWAIGSLLARRGLRTVAIQGAALIGLIALAGGIWMLRNWIESGNPVFPVKVDVGGVTIFDAPPDEVRERAGFTLLDYVGDWGVPWSDFILPQLRRTLAAPSLVLLVGLALAIVLVVRRRSLGMATGPVAAAAATAVLTAVAYTITPYSAGGPEGSPVLVGADARYAIPALLVAAAVAAKAAGVPRWGVVAFAALGLAAAIDGARWASGGALGAADLDVKVWGISIAATVALIWVGLWIRARPGPWTRLGPGLAVLALLVAAAGGYEVQQRFNDNRYRGIDPTVDWIAAHASSGERIGLAGVWDDQGISPVLPAFGPRFGNQVEYVGENVDDTLHRYGTQDEFSAALRGRYDYVIVGRGRPEAPRVPELRWATAAGFELVAESDRLALLRSPESAATAAT